MFRYTGNFDISYAPTVNIMVDDQWMPVNLADVENKFGSYGKYEQPFCLGDRQQALEAANHAALKVMFKEHYPIKDSWLAKAHAFSGDKIFFLNRHFPDRAAYYSNHSSNEHPTELEGFIKPGDCAFLSPYPKMAETMLLDPIAKPAGHRNAYIHELGHWLDDSLSRHITKNAAVTVHSELPLYKFIASVDAALSSYLDTHSRIFAHRGAFISHDADPRHIPLMKQRESFAEFAAHYYSGANCTSSPLVSLYFGKILEFQLQTMADRWMQEKDLSPLVHLATALSGDAEQILDIHLSPEDKSRLYAIIIEAGRAPEDALSDKQGMKAKAQIVSRIVGKLFDSIIEHTKQKAPELDEKLKPGSEQFQMLKLKRSFALPLLMHR